MKTKACSGFVFLLIGFSLLCCAGYQAQAIVIGSSTDNGNGTFTYSYTVDNTVGAADIFAFSLEFNFPSGQIDWNQLDVAGGGDVTVPNLNWIAQAGVPVIGMSSQDFLSLLTAGDVTTGTSLSGFSFISALAPGSITYYFEFDTVGGSASGNTVGPLAGGASVPDSGSSLAFLSISFGVLASVRRRFK